MFNNPMMMILQAFQGGGNPMAALQNMAKGDKRIAMGLQMINGKSPEQIQQMMQNMLRERGTTMENVLNSLGIRR